MILSGIRSEVSKGVLLFASTFVALVLACPTTARAQAGTPIWTNHYNGPGNNDDTPVAVATDNNGNTFVTGSSVGSGSIYGFATIKYSSGGVPMWTNRYSGPTNSGALAAAMGVDASGNVFVTGSAASDFITIKYANSGVPLWTNRYNSPFNNDDAPSALAVDTNGNVWVTGHSIGLIGYDYLTLGYSNNGAPLWVNRYSPLPDFGDDSATAIAVDTNGRVIVTGYSLGTTGTDFATVAYSKTGAPLWTNRYEGPLSANERAVAVGVNQNGIVFVTGTGDEDYVTLGYTNNGATYWTNRYDSNPPGGIDRASALVVDGNGDVIVTGFSVASYLTIKFASNGVPIWTNSYFGPFGYPAEPAAIGVDSSNNVFVTGRSWSATFTYYEFATQAYSSDGTPMWTQRYNTPGNFSDQAVALAVDRFGNVSVTGISTSGGGTGTPDYSTVKYLTAIPPTSIPINIQLSGNKIILSWDNSGMKLQSAPAVSGPYNDVPGAMSPYSANIAGNQQFFRLVPR